jgi:hypothetical protein
MGSDANSNDTCSVACGVVGRHACRSPARVAAWRGLGTLLGSVSTLSEAAPVRPQFVTVGVVGAFSMAAALRCAACGPTRAWGR